MITFGDDNMGYKLFCILVSLYIYLILSLNSLAGTSHRDVHVLLCVGLPVIKTLKVK